MSTDADVNKYRKKYHRCKTCIHASNSPGRYRWYCKAKQSQHTGDLYDTKIAGALCKIYAPILLEDGGVT